MNKNKLQTWQVKQRQALSLDIKIQYSITRIRQWYNYWGGKVCVSFSGGKDSTVLLHLVRSIYPDVPGIFCDTGLEYPEIRDFVKQTDNITWLKPSKSFVKVIQDHGYPVISKNISRMICDLQKTSDKNKNTRQLRLIGIKMDGTKGNQRSVLPKKWRFLINAPFKISDYCCEVMKKLPFLRYKNKEKRYPYVGTLADESNDRMRLYMKNGCNVMNAKMPKSQPIMFWTTEDIWNYIRTRNIQYCSIYDNGVDRTGCMFCMFGIHYDKTPNRFQLMKTTHPKQYDYCINKLGCGNVLDYIGIQYE